MNANDFYLNQIDFAINILAAKCKEVREEHEELVRIVYALREENASLQSCVERLESQYGVVLKQRDEARREVCFLSVFDPEVSHLNYDHSEREEARIRRWDCFDNLSDQE